MQPASPVESCLFSPIFPVFHDKILHSLSFPLTAHGDARSSEELNQNMRLLTQARSHFVRFCNISLIRISQGTTPHCPPLCSHQTGPGPPVRDVITTRLSSDARWPSPGITQDPSRSRRLFFPSLYQPLTVSSPPGPDMQLQMRWASWAGLCLKVSKVWWIRG